MTNKTLVMVAGLALLFLLTTTAPAAERQMLPGHVPAAVAQFNLLPMGRLPATDRMDLAISLPLRNRDALTNLLQQVYDPRGTNFHRYLTPKQFTERFGPTEKDYQALISFAKTNGLTVTGTHPNRILLDVNASVLDVEKVFHVKMMLYQHPTETRTFFAPDVEPSIDLAVPLLEIGGLNNFQLPHPALVRGTPPAIGQVTEGSGTNGAFWGYDFRAVYVPGTPLTGSGQVVGLYELDGYYTNDITAYETQTGLSNVTVVNVPVDNFNQLPSTVVVQVEEVSLDIEMVIAMAPGLSKVLVYEGPDTGPGAYDTLNRMATDNLASQLSSSWFLHLFIAAGAGPPTQDQIYMEFAAQGQSFFQCAGDADAYCPTNVEWADDPYITIVGGTIPSTTKAGGPWAAESVWNVLSAGTGGGISASYMDDVPIPSWQQGVSMSLNGGSTTMRNVPDVAMIAADVLVISNDGSNTVNGGTSIAAPLWAGFTALVNEQAVANGQPTVGFLNPALYAIGQGPNYTNCFHDITIGNNGLSLTASGQPITPCAIYYATNGYDLCTGWGSPNGINLINALMPYTGAIWVDFNYTGGNNNGSYQYPFTTLAQGAAAVPANGNVWIKTAGSSTEPVPLRISKAMKIRAAHGTATVGH